MARLKTAQTELEMLDRQLASKQAEEKRLRGVMAGYQARVEATAARESELTSLTRDYDTLQKNYQSLLSKQEDSKVAANIESRQIGEQFRLPRSGAAAREARQPEPAADQPAGRRWRAWPSASASSRCSSTATPASGPTTRW